MPDSIISLNCLTKDFGKVLAARELPFPIERGTIFVFLGANGAGKTTTMRMLCGLTQPTSGRANIAGFDVWKNRQAARTKFGYVAQRFSLYPDLTVEENLRFFGGACRVPAEKLRTQLEDVLRLTDLEKKRAIAAGSLSGGMRQLLALACA